MNLNEIREAYIAEGLSYLDATARTSQDVMLYLIAKSPLAPNVTIKGGVVIQHLTGDSRRATQDLDFDFIRYPIADESIAAFIDKMNLQSEDINIEISSPIEELLHQDYKGKRVYIRISDEAGTSIDTKLDIGIHKSLDIRQTDYCFDLGKLDDSVTLLINTKEQIFTEKMKSLLRIGAVSTRYKDVYDMYYLAVQVGMNPALLRNSFKAIIYNDVLMREKDIPAIATRLDKVLKDRRFFERLNSSKRSNWLNVPAETVVKELLEYVKKQIQAF